MNEIHCDQKRQKLYSPTLITQHDTVYKNAPLTHIVRVFGVHFDKFSQLRKHKRWNTRFAIFTESVHAKQYQVIQSA